ncbi:MAG: hypothetical protein WB992_01785 [Bryobacteraceae bacterium]
MPQTKSQEVQVDFDCQFIEKWLSRQRYFWYAIILLLLLTMSGLLGRGPLARRTVFTGPSQLGVTYERMLHFKTPSLIGCCYLSFGCSVVEQSASLARSS